MSAEWPRETVGGAGPRSMLIGSLLGVGLGQLHDSGGQHSDRELLSSCSCVGLTGDVGPDDGPDVSGTSRGQEATRDTNLFV